MCVNCNNNACGGCQPVIPQGLPGVNGKNAYTYTASSFTVPAIGTNVQITVKSTGSFTNKWAQPGQIIYIDGAGYYQVVSIDGSNQLTVTNPSAYSAVNTAPGITIASDKGISPAGIKGDTGASGAAGANGVANLYSNSVVTSTSTISSYAELASYTVPATTLLNYSATAADALLVTIGFTHTYNSINAPFPITKDIIRVSYFGKNMSRFVTFSGDGLITLRLSMASTSTLSVNYSVTGAPSYLSLNNVSQYGLPFVQNKIETGIDFGLPSTISVSVYQSAADRVILKGFYVDKIVA